MSRAGLSNIGGSSVSNSYSVRESVDVTARVRVSGEAFRRNVLQRSRISPVAVSPSVFINFANPKSATHTVSPS